MLLFSYQIKVGKREKVKKLSTRCERFGKKQQKPLCLIFITCLVFAPKPPESLPANKTSFMNTAEGTHYIYIYKP